MARWRLNTAHYLWVPGTEWEYTEVSRDTGRQARTRFKVCLLLNPNDPADWKQRNQGEITVCHEGKGNDRQDYPFIGDPTPDMEPLDDEAQAITDSLAKSWIHPIESLPGQGDAYGENIARIFEKQLSDLVNKIGIPKAPENVSAGMVTQAQFDELKKQLDTILAAQSAPVEPIERRV